MHVHDTGGSKLDGRMAIGCWVSFDEPSKAHCVYWPDRRIITVECSVKFNFNAVPMVIAEVPLMGEWENTPIEWDSSSSEAENTKEQMTDSPEVAESENIAPAHSDTNSSTNTTRKQDLLGLGFESNHSKGNRICKPSAYIKCLRSGEGHVSAHPSDPIVPKGVQPGTPALEPVDGGPVSVVEGAASIVDEWEGVAVEERAMAAVMRDVEGLEPSFEEARKCPDWSKWDEAAHAELESLKKNNMLASTSWIANGSYA